MTSSLNQMATRRLGQAAFFDLLRRMDYLEA
jgi:hypothetical protein